MTNKKKTGNKHMKNFFRKSLLGLAPRGGGARGLALIGLVKAIRAEWFCPNWLSYTNPGAFFATR